MERHGRAARLMKNPSIGRQLLAGEHQVLTTRDHCDCGTVLACGSPTERLEARLAREAVRLARKGWTESKIARAIADQRRADTRPRRAGPDRFELWNAILHDLIEDIGLPYVGLFVGNYTGAINVEEFAVVRRDMPRGEPWLDMLTQLRKGELAIFRAD